MAETSTRWWLTQDSTETIIDAPPERIYDTRGRHAPDG